MSLRDDIRAATVGAQKHFKSEAVQVSGQSITVRQITYAQACEVGRLGRDEKGTTAEYYPLIMIRSCFDAEDKSVFEASDLEMLTQQPVGGGWFADLIAAIDRLAGNSKNSEATTPDNGSSPLPE